MIKERIFDGVLYFISKFSSRIDEFNVPQQRIRISPLHKRSLRQASRQF